MKLKTFSRVTLCLLASFSVLPEIAAAQCNYGTVGTMTGITYSGMCSGTNPHQTITSSRSVPVYAHVACQDNAWKSDQISEGNFPIAGDGECEGAPEGTPPACEAIFGAPNFFGINNGKVRVSLVC